MLNNICDKKLCSGCAVCKSLCPKNAISMVADESGFLYPTVNTFQCIDCGICKKVCPVLSNNNAIYNGQIIKAYAAINNNEEIRLESSSGGIFTLIAERVLNDGGVVFGAAFDKDFNVIHTYTDTIDGLKQFRGSKYVQSVIGETFLQAREFLESGRIVLFSGTPCQIAGLYSFLDKKYDNLITQDLICHGVPSPAVWRKYIDYREKISHSRVRGMTFRRKNSGWKTYSVSFEFSNDTEYVAKLTDDPYMQVFLHNLCLRQSCYNCKFKTVSRQADITLADFWGIEKVLPEMDDNKGTSLVLIHSDKGSELLDSIKTNIIIKDANLTDSIINNPSVKTSAIDNGLRESFLRDLNTDDFDELRKKYCGNSFGARLRRKVAALKRRIVRIK